MLGLACRCSWFCFSLGCGFIKVGRVSERDLAFLRDSRDSRFLRNKETTLSVLCCQTFVGGGGLARGTSAVGVERTIAKWPGEGRVARSCWPGMQGER